jgi:septation ring formation regulator EzrA
VAFEWLETLETKVREAVQRLEELGEENQELRAQVEKLESRLTEPSLPFGPADDETEGAPSAEDLEVLQARVEELEAALTQAESDRDEARSAADRYSEEREEIRRRVEALTQRLEGLAGE